MESDDGASAPALQPPSTEPTAAGEPTLRQRQQQQPQDPHTYAEMAAASLTPPPAGGPEFAPGGENPQSSTHGASPPQLHQPSSSHTVPSDASKQSRRRPASVLGPTTSVSESSQTVPPPDEGQTVVAVQHLSHSAKKRRKRNGREHHLRGLTEEQHEAQPCSDPEKGDDAASQMEKTSSSMLSIQQSVEWEGGGTSTAVPAGSTLSTQISPKREEGETCTQGPSGSTLTTQDRPKHEEGETCTEVPSGSKLSTQDPPKHDEGATEAEGPSGSTLTQHPTKRESVCTERSGGSSSTEVTTKREAAFYTEGPSSSTSPTQDTVMSEASACIEGTGGSSSSTHQKSQPSDTHMVQGLSQDLPSKSAMLPGTSKFQSTFPTIEEIRSRLRCRTRTHSTSHTELQISRQKSTDSSNNTAQEEEGAAAQEDTESVKGSSRKCSTAESPASSSKIGSGRDGSDDEDSPDTGSFRSSIEPPWVYEDTFRDLQVERDREDNIMSVISNFASKVSNLAGHFTQVIGEVFSDALLGSEDAGPSGVANGNGNADGNADNRDTEPLEYDDTHEETFENIKVYMYETCVEAAARWTAAEEAGKLLGPTDLEALVQALSAAVAAHTSVEPSSQTSQGGPVEDPTDTEHALQVGPSTSSQAQAGSSMSAQWEPVAHCSKQPDPTASGRGETSPRRAFLQRFDYDIICVAACRVYKMRGSCMMLYNGIVGLVKILSVALEAYRGVQEVVDRIVRPPYSAANEIVGAVADGAFDSSERLRRALSEAEKAIRIHYEFSNNLQELQRLLATLQPDQPKAHEITDRPALLEKVVSLLEQSCDVIDKAWLRTGTGPDSAVRSHSPPVGTPLEAFEALLVATEVGFRAVESAMTSLDVIYNYELSRAAETQDTDDDYD